MFRKCSIVIVLLIVSLALTAFSGSFQEAGQNGGIPWWVWVVVILVLLALLIWWWLYLRPGPREKAPPAARVGPEAPTLVDERPAPVEKPAPPPPVERPVAAPPPPVERPVAAPPPPVEKPVPPKPDDLRRIEGIGPKISSVLRAAGITTFAQLAATDVSRLEQILEEEGIRLADPGTWPDQARLAAAGAWDELKALQDRLKGGRRA